MYHWGDACTVLDGASPHPCVSSLDFVALVVACSCTTGVPSARSVCLPIALDARNVLGDENGFADAGIYGFRLISPNRTEPNPFLRRFGKVVFIKLLIHISGLSRS